MRQLLQVGIIVLLLLAIFGVVLTPDPGDGPAGVVRLEKGGLPVSSHLAIAAVVPCLAATSLLFSLAQVPRTVARLDLICSRLC
jgi:hypothetical protein